jgi:sugar diacid utilization regulator
MAVHRPSARTDAAAGPAVRVIAHRLANQREQVAARIVERSRQEIIDYGTPSDSRLLAEVLSDGVAQIDALVASLRSGEPVSEEHYDRAREIAARRFHEGVPLESLLHAVRLWAALCWNAVLGLTRTDVKHEREAALQIASTIMDFADRLSTVFTEAYLDEVTDRGLLRRDLLDALLTSHEDGNSAVRLARRLHLRLQDNYVVVVVRGDGVEAEQAREQSQGSSNRLDHSVEVTRRTMRPKAGSPLTGMRNGDLVVLYPAASPIDLEAIRQDCLRLAAELGGEVSIGMSGWHEGRPSLGVSYAEARDAVAIAERLGIGQRAVGLDEVLVDHLLAASAPARGILDDVLAPLQAYDASRQAALVETLRAYLLTRFNVTKAAEALFVNPNTVVYRLRRIKELSGRDTRDLDDLLVLYLALKLQELGLGR